MKIKRELKVDKDLDISKMRHSAEHVLTQAVLTLYPKTLMAMGPATEEGFYFDLDPQGIRISEEDFPEIEKEMGKIVKDNLPITQTFISPEEAKKIFINNPYKMDWISEIEKRGEKVSIYKTGNKFTDLCSGPHMESTGKIGPFKLLTIAGAYWHGDEKNKMLTRIYGTCFPTKEELDHYLWQVEEAKKRDHRKLGRDLGIYTISEEVGPGLILWLPKGTIVKDQLEEWGIETEKKWGYQKVCTPEITKANLFYTSGHLPYYKKDMYPAMKEENGEEYYLKPMNCPHHHMIFKSQTRSYKELPLRLSEYGHCYRYEASGELFGLLRVRGMTQNDAHIYCTEEQAVDEFVSVMKLHQYYYDALGIKDYYLELALRDPKNKKKYHGNEEMWQKAEYLMKKAVAKTDIRMEIHEGNAAFYGPKIDFIIKSSIGRTFAASTNQIDLYMGRRFNLKYIETDGSEKTPVIIHRAPLGSSERFIGFLLEQYAGALPLWLSPIQVMLIPISEKHFVFAQTIEKKLLEAKIRVEIDNRNERMQTKIRNATLQKIPFIAIIGDKEIQSKDYISLRSRDKGDIGLKNINEFIKELQETISAKR